MKEIDANYIIIGGASIIILSYLFNLLAKKTSIPSVLMLILLGFLSMLGTSYFDINVMSDKGFKTILSVLGTVGLILIVLEASLDLELQRHKVKPILMSLLIGFLGLIITTAALALIFVLTVQAEWTVAILHAMPLAIISSAIVIPSISNLIPVKKEFLVYESAFSDILGIMVFYFYKDSIGKTSALNITGSISLKLFLTILLSVAVGYVLIIVIQKLTTHVKFFLLMAVLFIIYSVGKLEHLSPMLAIMFFGIVINNNKIFFRGVLQKWIDDSALGEILHELKVMTLETAFLVRTFFFFIFGFSINSEVLLDINAIMISLLVLGAIYLTRIGLFATLTKGESRPQNLVAPRGLISILLFFQIPAEFKTIPAYDGVLLIVIIVTSLVMTFALINNRKKTEMSLEDHVDEQLNTESITTEEGSNSNSNIETSDESAGLQNQSSVNREIVSDNSNDFSDSESFNPDQQNEDFTNKSDSNPKE